MRWLHSCYFFNLCWWHIGFSDEFIREFSICTMDGFCKSKTSNIASSPRRLSGPLRVLELGGPMNDKVGAYAHEWNWHSSHPRIIRLANRKFAIKVIPYACPTYTTWWTHSLAGGRIYRTVTKSTNYSLLQSIQDQIMKFYPFFYSKKKKKGQNGILKHPHFLKFLGHILYMFFSN